MIALSSQPTMQTISSKQVSARHIAFIDSAVDDYQYLAANVLPGIETIILDPSTDGVWQIAAALGDRTNISSLHIISHGSEASLQLGATDLNAETLWRKYADAIESWGKALSHRAEILVYGCNVASGKLGQDFVQWLSVLTGATVAASTTRTGNRSKGGNWELEVTTGAMQTFLAFPLTVQQAYQGVLMPPIFYTVTRYDDVDDPNDGRLSIREAVALAAQHPGPDGIVLNDQVRLTRPMEIRTNNSLLFQSGNLARGSISGQNTTSLFLIERQNPGENVVFSYTSRSLSLTRRGAMR